MPSLLAPPSALATRSLECARAIADSHWYDSMITLAHGLSVCASQIVCASIGYSKDIYSLLSNSRVRKSR